MLKQAFFKNIFLLIPLFLFSIEIFSQQKYWLEYNARLKDVPEIELENLKAELKNKYQEDISFHYESKWHPVISIETTHEIATELSDYEWINSITSQIELVPTSLISTNSSELSYALEQIQAHYLMDSMKLSGKGVNIGIIDGGFMDADKEPSLLHLVENDQIKFFKDFLLAGNNNPFYGKRLAQDDHGTQVLKMIAGSNDNSIIRYGMAKNASIYLARTDHGIRERRLEEDYWIEAIELFHEMDIKLVNSSLGYTDGYDKRKENHSVNEVNGKSSMITKTAQMAAEKGMLIVSAAGNDGHNKWKIISLPSDAKDVLTVGATRFDDWSRIYYSSVGPEKLDYVKPDVACFAANGTSFSAPVITGLAACIWEYDSTLSNYEVMEIIKNSAHLSEVPNNYLGYGVPNGKKIHKTLLNKGLDNLSSKLIKVEVSDNDYTIQIPDGIKEIVIYHKSSDKNVKEELTVSIESEQKVIIIEKEADIKYSTIVAQDRWLTEIMWK